MRVSDCPHSIESSAFRENAYLEWMTSLSCGARWSRTTGADDVQMKKGLPTSQPQSAPPCPRMWEDDATATNDKQDRDVFRMQSVRSVRVVRVPPSKESPTSSSVPSCSTL